MKHVQTFENFINEQTLNEYGAYPEMYSILSIGTVNISTGKSKYFNIYDTWKEHTVEIYKDKSPGGSDKYKLVFTSGSQPINNRDKSAPKAGDMRSFKDDQRGNPLFPGEFVDSCPIGDLKSIAAKYGIKSATGYTYK